MITNTGKTLISKYLTGQAPAYASYLAIGCGPAPQKRISYSVDQKALAAGVVTLRTTVTHNIAVGDYVTISGLGASFDGVYVTISGTTSTTIKYTSADATTSLSTLTLTQLGTVTKNYSTKTALDFEVARFPIISPRGYVTENGISKIVFTGEIPTETRFEITEIGVFSAASNPSAISNDSRILYNFDSSEGWQYYNGSTLSSPALQTSLDTLLDGNIVGTYDPVFLAGADNVVFSNYSTRLDRQERPRYGSNTYFMLGNTDDLGSQDPGTTTTPLVIGSGSTKYLETTNNIPLDLSQNSSNDEIRLAFSVVSKTMTTAEPAGNILITVRFLDTAGLFADMKINIAPTISTRYQVVNTKLSAFTITTPNINFNWSSIQKVQVYSSIYSSGTTTLSTDHYVALDAIRLENVSTVNSLYGLTGYSPVVNVDSITGEPRPIVKEANVPNLAEFRFVMDVT